eukprot:gb/GECH01012219.1/.p1 GENE.gb/GECH01012219.1/~~gb/GECH01012219.1/.p1  ORF type:complete len:1516 (+),score=395.49 gb/GECH01012219.1/:1-4548(+)
MYSSGKSRKHKGKRKKRNQSQRTEEEQQQPPQKRVRVPNQFEQFSNNNNFNNNQDHHYNRSNSPQPNSSDMFGFVETTSLSSSRAEEILNGIKNDSDEGEQLQCIMELCSFLALATEDSIRVFSSSFQNLVDGLVHLLRDKEHNPEMMLLSARSLTHLLDVLPQITGRAVEAGVVGVLCEKLLNMQFLDLAEQSIKALEKISQEDPQSLIDASALNAIFTFIDFFPLALQRTAVSIASQLCRQAVRSRDITVFKDTVQPLTNFLNFPDEKIIEYTCHCFNSLVLASGSDLESLSFVLNHGLIQNLITILSSNQSEVNNLNIFKLSVETLSSIFKKSSNGVSEFINNGGISTISQILNNDSQSSSSTSKSPSNGKEKTKSILGLIFNILPTLSPSEKFVSEMSNQEKHELAKLCENGKTTLSNTENEEKTQDNSLRELYSNDPEILANMAEMLLHPLLEIHNSTVGITMQHKCISCIAKLIYFSSSPVLERVLKNVAISTFLATLLNSSDMVIVATTVQIVIILFDRLPHIFKDHFAREGVLNVMKRLAAAKTHSEEPLFLDTIFDDDKLREQSSESKTPKTPTKSPQPSNSGNESPFKQHLRTPTSPARTPELCDFVVIKSRQFQTELKNYTSDLEPESTVCEKIRQCGQTLESDSDKRSISNSLYTICDLLVAPDGVSTFELMYSEVLDAFIDFLLRQKTSSFNLEIFLEIMGRQISNHSESSLTYLVLFIRKIQKVLESVDQLPVVLLDNDRISPILLRHSALALRPLLRPIHLKIKQESTKKTQLSIAISPLAKVQALEEYLFKKLKELKQESDKDDNSNAEMDEEKEVQEEENEEGEEESPSSSENPSRLFESSARLLRRTYESDEDYSRTNTHDITIENEDLESICQVFKTRESSYTGQLKLNGNVLPSNISVFHALYRYGCPNEFRQMIHPSTLSLHNSEFEIIHDSDSTMDSEYNTAENEGITPPAKNELDSFIEQWKMKLEPTPNEFQNHDAVFKVIVLLGFLSEINSHPELLSHRKVASVVLSSEFENSKLVEKITKQLQDPILACTSCLPPWCNFTMKHAKYLYPFETRRFYFQMTSLGSSRALAKLQEHGILNEIQVKIEKIKVRISRESLLFSALKTLNQFGNSKGIIEVEFVGEAGTGLGPTLEFFTLVSREFQQADLKLWVDDNTLASNNQEADREQSLYVQSSELFPRPIDTTGNELKQEDIKTISIFKALGVFVARALLDERLTDLPLSKPFLKYLIDLPLCFADIQYIKPMMYETISKLRSLISKKKEIEADNNLSKEEKNKQISSLKLDDASVEDMCLDFTLPGFPDVPLVPKGEDISVTIWNLEEWIDKVVHVMLHSGVKHQLESFKKGFSSVFPVESLQVFSVNELEELLFGSFEEWNISTLMEGTSCDHGYSHNSQAINMLFEVLLEMTKSERRMFLRFVTGSPKLPVGGLRSLNPSLTIVPSNPEEGQTQNDKLPSVMTCANYLKLPDYSSKEILRERLLVAIREGQQSFHLT